MFKLNRNYKKPYNYYPKNNVELEQIIGDLIEKRGIEANLNDIDTSKITDMSYLFYHSDFDGDISGWDMSNVVNATAMFYRAKFTGKNGDISNWDVHNFKSISYMFYKSGFNCDISKWDITSIPVINSIKTFYGTPLDDNEPQWYKNSDIKIKYI